MVANGKASASSLCLRDGAATMIFSPRRSFSFASELFSFAVRNSLRYTSLDRRRVSIQHVTYRYRGQMIPDA
jgi:hypothetical protein